MKEVKNKKLNIERIIRFILLIPPVLGVILFILNLFSNDLGKIVELKNLSSEWTGSQAFDSGGYTSATPIYLGLMAIAGAYLIKGTSKNL
ncbi:hypothetical protein [Aquimarina macrocephali]|uniref:hypothetical protein n=1 Tax=Aquimarina macrocephali TaxID=666563 RepID=UPI000464A6DC|nr:hypothetical protein [Aquimarina macrocephali]